MAVEIIIAVGIVATAPILIMIAARMMYVLIVALKTAAPYALDIIPTCAEIENAYASVGWAITHISPAEINDAEDAETEDEAGAEVEAAAEEKSEEINEIENRTYSGMPIIDTSDWKALPAEDYGDANAIRKTTRGDIIEEIAYGKFAQIDTRPRATNYRSEQIEQMVDALNAMNIGTFTRAGMTINYCDEHAMRPIRVIVVDNDYNPEDIYMLRDKFSALIIFNINKDKLDALAATIREIKADGAAPGQIYHLSHGKVTPRSARLIHEFAAMVTSLGFTMQLVLHYYRVEGTNIIFVTENLKKYQKLVDYICRLINSQSLVVIKYEPRGNVRENARAVELIRKYANYNEPGVIQVEVTREPDVVCAGDVVPRGGCAEIDETNENLLADYMRAEIIGH